MEIGEPERVWEIEPLEDPFEQPERHAPAPERTPAPEPVRTPEKVPA